MIVEKIGRHSRIHAVIQDDDASTIISQEPALRAEGPMDNLAERRKKSFVSF